jgi:hypothetical protein
MKALTFILMLGAADVDLSTPMDAAHRDQAGAAAVV